VAKLVLVLLLVWPAARAQTLWFTVMGDPGNASLNTIQVDPVPIEAKDGLRTMRVRVSRSLPRASWDGVPYRSYESMVVFDCARNSARYLSITYFDRPQWSGVSSKTLSYAAGQPRLMLFRDVEPNPTQRIIHAACGRTGAPR